MKTASLSGSPRGSVGKKDANELRKSERIPGVLYGLGQQHHFHVAELELHRLVYNPEVFRLEFGLDGKVHTCIFKEIQFHPVTDKILHIDLLELDETKPVRVDLPLRTAGTSPGVMAGGRLELQYRRVPVIGLPKDLPEFVGVDISNLEIGQNVRVRDLSVPNCTVLLSDSTLLAAVQQTRAAMAAAAAAAASK